MTSIENDTETPTKETKKTPETKNKDTDIEKEKIHVRAKIAPSDENYRKSDGRQIYNYLNKAENIEWNDKSHSVLIKDYHLPNGKYSDLRIWFGSPRAYTMTKNRYNEWYYKMTPYQKENNSSQK